MGINRYTQLTPSQFNPLSLEEIMLVPAMQRKKHDDTVKGLEEIRAKLANVDPEDKYFDEAMRLKKELDNKLTSQVENINREGFNPNTTGQFLAMNREYQDLASPTGKIGMINQEKKNTQAYIENYRKEGLALGLTPEQMQPWIDAAIKKRNEELPLYDEKGRTIGLKIDKNVVKAQDIFKDFAERAAGLGISSTARGNIIAGIVTTPDDKFDYVNTTGWDSEKSDNKKQIQATLDFFNSQLNDPNSDYSKYYDYVGRDKNSIVEQIKQQSGIYKKDVDNYKSSQQMSNLTDNRPRGGNGSDENETEKVIYSNSAETNSPFEGKTYDEAAKDAKAVLNNPKAQKFQKIEAQKTLDLIDETKAELLANDKNFKKRNDYTKGVENSQFMVDLIAKAEKEKSPYLNRLKSLQQKIKNGELSDVSSPNIFFTKGVEINGVNYGAEGLGKYAKELDNFFGKHVKQYNKYKSENKEAIDKAVKTRGFEKVDFTQDMKDSDRQNYFANIKSAINVDTATALNGIYIDSNGNRKKLEMNDNAGKQLINMLNLSGDDKTGGIVDATPSRQGSSVGLTVRFKPTKESEFEKDGFNHKFDGSQAIEMFIPISKFGDDTTNLQHTSNRVYNQLPPSLRNEFNKMVKSSGSTSTTQMSRLGNLAVPVRNYLGKGKFNDDDQIDFLKSGKNNDALYTPYVIDKNNKKTSVKWNNVVDYKRLNEPEYFQKLANNGILDNIIFSYGKHSKSNKPLKDSQNNLDYSGMLNFLKYKDMKMKNTQDIVEFSEL